MKDIIFNAHYAPGYLYDPIRRLGLPDEYDPWEYSERFDEYCEHRTSHWPDSYEGLQFDRIEYRAEFITPSREGCVIPNYPIEKYDTIARKKWEEEFEEPWPYGDIWP